MSKGINKTDIEWADFTANPITGKCPHFGTLRCGTYCYAEKARHRYKWNASLQFHKSVLEAIRKRGKPATIFIGSMIDIFADEIPVEWIESIFNCVFANPRHTFIILTKNPKRMCDFILGASGAGLNHIDYLYPSTWFGISITRQAMYTDDELGLFQDIPNNFISFEPIHTSPSHGAPQARGYIFGAESGRGAKHPSIESVKACLAHAGTKPIFIKDNLAKLFPDLPYHRELPWELHTK